MSFQVLINMKLSKKRKNQHTFREERPTALRASLREERQAVSRAMRRRELSMESKDLSRAKETGARIFKICFKRVKNGVYLINEGEMESFEIFIKRRLYILKIQLLKFSRHFQSFGES